ncbi:MAG TPA: hypothetical protein VGX46_14935 [Vicinamibacterales bacterium]|nr:hypothetical protein [Vicinamibacterales bacterium]
MEPTDPAGRDDESAPKPKRKLYQKPSVEVYGDLSEISKTVSAGTKLDGGGHPNKHFTN